MSSHPTPAPATTPQTNAKLYTIALPRYNAVIPRKPRPPLITPNQLIVLVAIVAVVLLTISIAVPHLAAVTNNNIARSKQ